MLHRQAEEGVIVISQPAHAWISGQMARAWGHGPFAPVPEEVCLAAEQHDIGFLDWELCPTLNPVTGLPYSFLELPTATHLRIWRTSIHQMLRFGRYPALLVSRHFTTLARLHPGDSPEKLALQREFLTAQDEFETTLETSLANDFHYAPVCTAEAVRQHQQLVSAWDWISLLLCHGLKKEEIVSGIPTRDGAADLKFTPLDPAGSAVAVSPWPFRAERLKLVCDGRRLLEKHQDEERLREALRAAAPLTILIELTRELKALS